MPTPSPQPEATNRLKQLGRQWSLFLLIALGPWTILSFFSVLLFFLLSTFTLDAAEPTTAERASTALVNIMLALSSAVFGTALIKTWTDTHQTGVLAVRAKGAVRNLTLLLRNIIALQKTVQSFLSQHPCESDEAQREVVKRDYEELDRFSNIICENTVAAIEHWTDILPEADIRTQIGEFSQLSDKLRVKEQELKAAQVEVATAKDQSHEDKQEKAKLERNLRQLTAEVRTLQNAASEKQATLPTSPIHFPASQSQDFVELLRRYQKQREARSSEQTDD